MQEVVPDRHVLQVEASEVTVVGTTGTITVPSVPAAVLGRRMWRTDPPVLRLSMKATFWPSRERTGDVVIGPPVPVCVS